MKHFLLVVSIAPVTISFILDREASAGFTAPAPLTATSTTAVQPTPAGGHPS